MEYFQFTICIPKQPWRWMRFRITTILLIIAVLAMALAWRRDHQQLSAEINRLQYPGPNWQPVEATGPPNTAAGDGRTAWCHLTSDDQQEWLVLEYDKTIVPTAIVIHENLGPGAVRRVSHYPKLGLERPLWEGNDPTPTTAVSGVSRLPVTADINTSRIKIYLDSPAVAGWHEIDAVGLVSADGKTIWATNASASSSYSQVSPKYSNWSISLSR
jgi:hypothetical protein